ncbi:MAG: hypothetical protein ACD_34C00253G0006 [uncultured bacterium]|nr:MAG: hypothetical protein ACD_34C00253G0006 [uncultured bacterium]
MKRLILLSLILTSFVLLTACGTTPTQTPVLVDINPATSVPTSSEGNTTPELPISTEVIVENTAPEVATQAQLDFSYENALSSRLMLALGTLKLAETENPVSLDQAPQLLLLWQALQNMTNNGTSPEEEVNAVLAQIEATLSSNQINLINSMKLSQTDIQTWATANGVTVGTGSGSGTGQGTGQGLSPEARATKQAENGMIGTSPNSENGLSVVITNALISYLENIN